MNTSSNSAAVCPLEDMEELHRYSGKVINISFEELNTEFQKNIGAKSISKLALNWNVSEESILRLGVGFDTYAYTFPMRNGEGKIIGIRKRPRKDISRKHAAKDSTLGIFIPEGVKPCNVQLINEGESDVAAALTLGFSAIGTPGAGAVLKQVVRFLQQSPIVCPCITGDNDAAGMSGAEKLADGLLEGGIPCRVLIPPEPYGDLREWLTRGGLTREGLLRAINAQEIRWPNNWPPGFIGKVPNALLRRGIVARIGQGPFALLCLIRSYYRPGGKVFPAREELARLLGESVSTVDRYKTVLVKAGLLTWKRGRTGRANEYYVNFGPCKGCRKRG